MQTAVNVPLITKPLKFSAEIFLMFYTNYNLNNFDLVDLFVGFYFIFPLFRFSRQFIALMIHSIRVLLNLFKKKIGFTELSKKLSGVGKVILNVFNSTPSIQYIDRI